MQLSTTTLLHSGGIIGHPASGDISRGVYVRVKLATGWTSKDVLASHSGHSAYGAGLAGVRWVYVLDFKPGALRLVFDELLELSKRPAGHHAVEVPISYLRSFADVLELFHADNSAVVPYGLRNERLTNHMILVSNPPVFVSGQALQNAPRASRSARLKAGPDSHTCLFEVLARDSRIQFTSRGSRRIPDTKIDAHGWPVARRIVSILNDNVNTPFATLFDHDGGCWILPFERVALIRAKAQRHMDSSAHHRQGGDLIHLAIVEDASVVVDACRLKDLRLPAAAFLKSRHHGGDPADGSNSQVGRQRKLGSNVVVALVVQKNVIAGVQANGDFENSVTGVCKSSAGLREARRHGWRRRHRAADGSGAHGDIYITGAINLNNKGDAARLEQPQTGGAKHV